MHHKKSPAVPPVTGNVRRVCPVCGSRSYSRSGIHPQCAQQQADTLRMQRVKARRSAAPKAKASTPAAPRPWHKLCPRCKAESHIRKSACACGYRFPAVKVS